MKARNWWPIAAVAVLLVVLGAAAAVSAPQLTRIPVPNSTNQPPTEEPQKAADYPTPSGEAPVSPARPATPDWLIPALVAILLTLLVGGLLTGIWMMARGRMRFRTGQLDGPVPRPAAASAEQVVAAVDAGLSDLSDTDLDPRRAVIACWVRLEQVAAAAGTPRQAADTPTDLVTRMLAAHYVDPGTLAAFADIYRLARYATHTVDEQMRGQARSALARVRADLTGVRT